MSDQPDTAPVHADARAPLLEVRGLTAGYGRTTVLRDISLRVEAATVDALLGPNGAGKTTLLRTIAGLVRPSAGSVQLNGTDITHEPPYRRARAGVCMIPEGRGIFPNLTVKENLLLQTGSHRPPAAIDRAFAAFPILRDRRQQVAGTLSGGQQQMLAAARCYLSSPSVILLDEVSMGLAPLIVDQIFESLISLSAEGIAIVLVEQYVNIALELASTVHLLNRGELTFTGAASELDDKRLLRDYLGASLGDNPVSLRDQNHTTLRHRIDLGGL
jgi:branched-chain amino acid transport system ATP-binding protein